MNKLSNKKNKISKQQITMVKAINTNNSMTLDEAIHHLQNQVLPNMKCSQCKNEHIQLLEWLKELKQFRQQKYLSV